jgi:DNA invertase Pin-like site-specific DNA recombinase
LFARKSSEDDERQALSIDSQINEMMAMAKRDGIEVVEVRRESHSAKASSGRPVYNQLLKDIREGEFNAILTWAPDRLSRNAGDLGTLVDLMDQGLLHEIRTHGQTFTNNPNEKFLLMILCSQAKLENDHRGINIKRGMKTRAEMGYRPTMAPLGYLTERDMALRRSRVVVDPIRGPRIKEMYELVAYKGFSGRKLYAWMKEIGFVTRKGHTVTLSMIYRMLRNTFYLGRYEFPAGSGKWIAGEHEPLIEKQLFEEVQRLLDAVPKKPWGVKDFAFTRLMRCGACGAGVTAEEKHKVLKDGSIKRYVYYRCTHTKDIDCPEPSLREDRLIELMLDILEDVTLEGGAIKKRIEEEFERHWKFMGAVLGQTEEKKLPKIDKRKYAKYLLSEGTIEEKRELLACIKNKYRSVC